MAESLATMPQTETQKIDTILAKLPGKSKAEVSDMIRSGELQPIIKDPVLRKKLSSGELTAPVEGGGDQNKPDEGTNLNNPGDSNKPNASEEKPNGEPGKNSPGDTATLWDTYKDDAAREKALFHQNKFINEQKDKLDKFNTERGQQGTQLKTIESERDELKNKLAKLEAERLTPPAAAPSIPAGNEKLPDIIIPELKLPKAPVVDGVADHLDEGFLKEQREALANHNIAVTKSLTAMNARLAAMANKPASDPAVQETLAKMKEMEKKISQGESRDAQELAEQNRTNLFGEVDGLWDSQKATNGVKRSFKEVDSDVSAHGGLEKAKEIMPAAEIEAYARTVGTVHLYKPKVLENGIEKIDPNGKSNFESMNEAYLIYCARNGIQDTRKKEDIESAVRDNQKKILDAQKLRGDAAKTLPNDGLGGEKIIETLDQGAKVNKLKDLMAEANKKGNSKQRNLDLMKEIKALSGLPFGKTPTA